MSRLSNIETLVKGAGKIAEKKLRKQLNIIRTKGDSPNRKRMTTSGDLSSSLKSEVVNSGGNRMTVVVTTEHKYGLFLDRGISDVPYSKGSGEGSKPGSAYIKGLASWAAKKFYGGDYKKGLKAAFRIAAKQKKEMKAPMNLGWVQEIVRELDNELVEYMRSQIMMAITIDVHKALHKTI
jgi:hypothetical protein